MEKGYKRSTVNRDVSVGALNDGEHIGTTCLTIGQSIRLCLALVVDAHVEAISSTAVQLRLIRKGWKEGFFEKSEISTAYS